MSNHARRSPLAAYWRYSDLFAQPNRGWRRRFMRPFMTWGRKR